MRVFGLSRRSPEVADGLGADSAAPLWSTSGNWHSEWEAPRNWIHSEGAQVAAVAALAGAPTANGCLMPVDVMLEREPRNRDDPDAVRAYVRGTHVGYVARSVAAQVSAAMAEAEMMRIVVPGVVRGGQLTRPHVGVHIWLNRGPDRITVPERSGRVPWPPSADEGDR